MWAGGCVDMGTVCGGRAWGVMAVYMSAVLYRSVGYSCLAGGVGQADVDKVCVAGCVCVRVGVGVHVGHGHVHEQLGARP